MLLLYVDTTLPAGYAIVKPFDLSHHTILANINGNQSIFGAIVNTLDLSRDKVAVDIEG